MNFSTKRRGSMATVNFSVPDEIKKRFNEVFASENKSHLIAELMKKAIEEHERKLKRAQAIDALLRLRAKQKPVSDKKIRRIRHQDR
jgi:metal-responsive CopG/Arc/MetJ family transcriptional regulator